MRVLVTGATGFLGSWIARALARAGHCPVAFVRPASRLAGLAGLDIERIAGDVLDRASVDRAVARVEAVVHAAGQTSVRTGDTQVYRVNVEGTFNVLSAAHAQRRRVVHTSSIAAVGATREPALLDERADVPAPGSPHGYVASKRAAERIARDLAAEGLDVVITNPGILLGPGDVHFTSTQIVLYHLRGLMPFYPRGGISFLDVRDAAAAHVAALTAGRRGERYLLGGENLTYRDLFAELSAITGLPRPWPMPWAMAETAAFFSTIAAPFGGLPFEQAADALCYGQLFSFCDSAKARRELGLGTRPLRETLADTIADELARGAARATTPSLRALLHGRPAA